MRSEHAAHLSLVQETAEEKRRRVRERNMKTIEEEKQRKRDINAQFWHSMKEIIFMIVCAAIAIYTLIHFAG